MTNKIDTPDTPVVIGEILAGDALNLYEAAAKVPKHRGKATATSTLWRWHRKGAKSPDGRRVHLEMARFGAKWLTSAAALARFFAALTPPVPDVGSPAPTPAPRSERRQTKAAQRASSELERLGA